LKRWEAFFKITLHTSNVHVSHNGGGTYLGTLGYSRYNPTDMNRDPT
jgi:hypothetical protein